MTTTNTANLSANYQVLKFFITLKKNIYTYKLSHFANKLQNTCTRVIAYTFGILIRVRRCP